MKKEEIMVLTLEELETRAAEIAEATTEADNETLDSFNEELDAIEERKAQLKVEIESRKAAEDAILAGEGKVIEERAEETTMTNMEIRNTPEYIDAFAKYIKTGKDTECRSLLTENVDGTVPVPELVEGRVRTAWENDEIFSRVTKTFVKGNLKVGFEVSATNAEVHVEGSGKTVQEEDLVLGIVNLVPQTIKKWITFSTEVMDMDSGDFLAYVYDELTYKIVQKAADTVIAKIKAAPATSTGEKVGVAQVEGAVTAETVIDAVATLGNSAQNNVLIASGTTIAGMKKAALNAHYAYDPFAGLTVITREGLEGAIVGDLSGVQANLPAGEAVKFVFDELSLAEEDLVKLVGRLYAAIEVTGPKMFAVIDGTASE